MRTVAPARSHASSTARGSPHPAANGRHPGFLVGLEYRVQPRKESIRVVRGLIKVHKAYNCKAA